MQGMNFLFGKTRRSPVPAVLGAALALAVVSVVSPRADAHEPSSDQFAALSTYEDSKGGPENVIEAERRAILRGLDPRVLGAATVAAPAVRAAAPTPSSVLRKLSDYEDTKGGAEQVTEVERRAVLRGRTPRVLGAATEATTARVIQSGKSALEVVSDFEDARGGKENVTEAERLAILHGVAPRVLGASTIPGAGIQSLRGEVVELTPDFVEVRYQNAVGVSVHRKFSLSSQTHVRAHIQRGDQVEVRFDRVTWAALVVRDLAPAGEEVRFGANDCAECPGAVA